jgi:hypothetical protein
MMYVPENPVCRGADNGSAASGEMRMRDVAQTKLVIGLNRSLFHYFTAFISKLLVPACFYRSLLRVNSLPLLLRPQNLKLPEYNAVQARHKASTPPEYLKDPKIKKGPQNREKRPPQPQLKEKRKSALGGDRGPGIAFIKSVPLETYACS